jgi:hypothetical protein
MTQLKHPKQNATHARRIYYSGLVCALLFIPVAIGGFATNGEPDLASMGLMIESVKQETFTKTVPRIRGYWHVRPGHYQERMSVH